MRPVLQSVQVVDTLDIVDSAYRQAAKRAVALAVVPASGHSFLVADDTLLADNVLVLHQKAFVEIADIDKASFAKALADFENCRVRACPDLPAQKVAEEVRWDRTDYYIDLAWSILFCIYAINKNEAI